MTIRVRAVVRRFPRVGGTPNGEPWLSVAYTTRDATDPDDEPDFYEMTWSGDIGEAIQAAMKLRDRIDHQLMDNVNASRASRRTSPRDIRAMEPTA